MRGGGVCHVAPWTGEGQVCFMPAYPLAMEDGHGPMKVPSLER